MEADLNYRFGWRWLLPVTRGDRIALRGFNTAEGEFLARVFPEVMFTQALDDATVWLIQNQALDVVRSLLLEPSAVPPANPRVVAILGSRDIVTGWQPWLSRACTDMTHYALVPPANPRVVVPLGVRGVTLPALSMHRPGRRWAQFQVAIVKLLVWLGLDGPLRQRSLCIATRTGQSIPVGARQADLSDPGRSRLHTVCPVSR